MIEMTTRLDQGKSEGFSPSVPKLSHVALTEICKVNLHAPNAANADAGVTSPRGRGHAHVTHGLLARSGETRQIEPASHVNRLHWISTATRPHYITRGFPVQAPL